MTHVLWVEVLGSAAPDGNKYYWHRGSQEVCWEAPAATRVDWAVDRDPASGRLFYWNRETEESTWTLPDPPPQWGPEDLQPSEQHAGTSLVSRTQPGDWQADTGQPRGAPDSECERLRRLLSAHAATVPGVQDCTDQMRALLSDGGGCALVLECEKAVGIENLLPPNSFLARPPEAACGVAGFVIIEVAASLHSAKTVVGSLGQHWRSLTQKSPKAQFATIVCAAPLQEHQVAEGSELTRRLIVLHERLSASAPAPLVVAAWRQQASGPSDGARLGGQSVLGGGGVDTWDETKLCRDSPWEAQRYDEWSAQSSDRDTGGLQDREEELVAEIAEFLQAGPREVHELARNFSVCFNRHVRSSLGRNDGGFKRWLLSRGFEVDNLTHKNSALIFAPTQLARGGRIGGGSLASWRWPSAGEPEPASWHWKCERRNHGKAWDAPVAPTGSEHEARLLEREVVKAVASLGPTDISRLSTVKNFGPRFNAIFFRKSRVNNGSFKKWIASLKDLELVTDPELAKYYGNNPTVVRIWVPPP